MNCAENLLEPTIFFNIYTQSPSNSVSESPGRKRDLSPTWKLDIENGLPSLWHRKPCLRSFWVNILLRVLKSVTWLDALAKRMSCEI